MTTFPVALKLAGRRCLVLGSGDEAGARAKALLDAGATVTLVSERPSPALEELAAQGALVLVRRAFVPEDLDGVWLAVLADRDAELGRRVNDEAEARRVLFCAVDQPEVGSFSHLGIARAGLVFAAVGTHGEAPALARRLRQLLSELFARSGLADFADRLAALRRSTPPERRHEVLNAAVGELRLEGELVVPKADDEAGGD